MNSSLTESDSRIGSSIGSSVGHLVPDLLASVGSRYLNLGGGRNFPPPTRLVP